MRYNIDIKKTDPSAVINSPKMVKFGTLVDEKHNFFGSYIVFEGLKQKDVLTRERISKLTEDEKNSIRKEMEKFHSGLKIRHGNVCSKNVVLDDEGVAHFINLQVAENIISNDDFWVIDEKRNCELTVSYYL